MIIRFKNWEKYQGRKDVTKPHWLRVQNDLFYDPKLYELKPEELVAFIYLLCEASRANNNGECYISTEHFRIHARLPDRVCARVVQKLQQLQIIEQPTLRGRYASVRDLHATLQNRTEQNRTEQEISPISPKVETGLSFDFNALYKEYPRKEGKSRGLKICGNQIKSEADYEALRLAISNYKAKKAQTDPKFLQTFSTFMGSWRDWLDTETGTALKAKTGIEIWYENALKQEAEKNGTT